MFVRAANPIWYFVNLVGTQLDDTYYAFFLQNTFPYLPQPIYQTPSGTFWSDPIQFLPNGTLPDDLYFNPSLIYRIEIRQGATQDAPLIYEINNYIPGSGSVTPSTATLSSGNQVSNPEFAFINFTSPLNITIAGTYSIAPGWNLVLTGAGTTTAIITQSVNSGNQGIINNPPFALEFNLKGWSSAILSQEFDGNGALFFSTPTQSSAITISVNAESNDGIAWPITLQYVPSVGMPQVVTTQNISVGSFGVVVGALTLDPSTNTDPSTTANVQLQIVLPPNGDILLSSIQLIGEAMPVPLVYQQESPERQLDQLFHYYYNSIIMQPKDSILTGWKFALNPWQFRTTTISTVAPIASYITDQTILVQKNASSVMVGQAAFNNNLILDIVALTTNNIFALIQYIDPATIRPYWNEIVSSMVKAQLGTLNATTLQFKMRLIYRSSLPPTIGSTEPIASWGAIDPVFSSGWTAIAPLNDPVYTLQTPLEDFSFDQFQLPFSTNINQTLGIVFYTTTNMSITGTPDFILIDDISLVPNQFAIESNPITFDESLRRCQFYYEKSYDNGVLPGTTSSGGSAILKVQNLVFDGTSIWQLFATPFDIEFNSVKRAAPSVFNILSPSTGTNAALDLLIFNGATIVSNTTAISNWTIQTTGTKTNYLYPANATILLQTPNIYTAQSALSGLAQFHFTADSRLGV